MVFAPKIGLAQDEGVAIHEFIGLVARVYGAAATTDEIISASAVLGTKGLAPVYRQSIRQRVVTAAGRYFTRFAPKGWAFWGAEWIVGGVALDLLWESKGRLMADEIKTGAVAMFSEEDLNRQIAAQTEAGRLGWGEAFLGVRAIRLREPELSDLELPSWR